MGVIGSIFSGIFGASQANKAATVEANASTHAADLQKQAADESLAFQKQQYGNSLNLMAPWLNSGSAANSRLSYLMGLNPAQGLPPGVINPNAPPASSGQTLNGGGVDLNSLNQLRALRGGGPNGTVRNAMPQNSSMLQPGQNAFGGSTNQVSPYGVAAASSGGAGGTQFQMNPTIASPGTQGGAAGMLQLGPNGQPTGVTPDVNPFPNGIGSIGSTTSGQMLGDPSPFGTGGMGNIGSVAQNASGAPGTVARTDGGTGPDVSAPGGGGFGSLAQGWGQTFSSPTAVTEQNDPGYQFRLQQGQKALEASAAARGGLLTGGTAKAINDYAQNSASGEYSNVYNRALQNYQTNYNTFTNDQTNLYNRLASMSGQGQVSANQLSGAGQNFANSSGNILMGSAGQQGVDLQNAANARGSGYINQANAYGNMANNLGGAMSLFQLLGGGA